MTTTKEEYITFTTKFRLMRELYQMTENPPPLITAQVKDGDIFSWIATIQGPPGTPYEEGKFNLSLNFPPRYPFQHPDVKFITKIYHANIDDFGTICWDVLEQEWTPTVFVEALLVSISTLLYECNPDIPMRSDIAMLYKNDRKEHDRKAREYTRKYAM